MPAAVAFGDGYPVPPARAQICAIKRSTTAKWSCHRGIFQPARPRELRLRAAARFPLRIIEDRRVASPDRRADREIPEPSPPVSRNAGRSLHSAGTPSANASTSGNPKPSAKDGSSSARAPLSRARHLGVGHGVVLDDRAAQCRAAVEHVDDVFGLPAALADQHQARRRARRSSAASRRHRLSSSRWFLRASIVPTQTK